MSKKVLIVEDNPDIAANIGDYLEGLGYIVDFACDGKMGVSLALEHRFDVIILDINLPKLDGFSVSQMLRKEHDLDTPILMLTARGSIDDKTQGFAAGAWDYLVKPFELKELALRLEALALRHAPQRKQVLQMGDIQLDINRQKATREGMPLDLHKASLHILEILIRSWPNIVTRQDLEFALWGDNPPNSDSLRTHIYELRTALDKPFDFPMLKTVRGVGYCLETQGEKNEG